MKKKSITNRLILMVMALFITGLLYGCGKGDEALPEASAGEETAEEAESEKKEQGEDADEGAEEPALSEESEHLHPVMDKKYVNYHDGNYNRLVEASWEELTLEGDEAEKYEALSAALKKQFEEAGDNIKSIAAENVEYAQDMLEEYDGTLLPFEAKNTINLQRCDKEVLSFTVMDYEYTGGAHGMYGHSGYNYDVKTGKLLSLKEIFTETENLAETISERLLSQYDSEVLFEPDGLTEYVEECIREDRLNTVLTNRGVRVFFNPYEIAPYSEGVITVDLYPEEYPGIVNAAYGDIPENWIVKLDINEIVNADIDGNGTGEKIYYCEDVEYYQEEDYSYSEIVGFTVYAGEEELRIPAYCYGTQGYFIRDGEKSFLYVMCHGDNDYVSLYTIDMTGGTLREAEEDSVNAYVSAEYWDWDTDEASNMESGTDRYTMLTDPKNMKLFTRTMLLGTVDGYRMMHVGENGVPVPNEGWEDYRISSEYAEFTALQDVKGILLDEEGKEGAETVISKGETVKYVATDNDAYGDVERPDGTRVRLYVDEGDYKYTIGGIDLMELFEGIVFAG